MIPKVLHFCFGMTYDFGGKPWGLSHYVCVRSAIERIKPNNVYLYYEYKPTGPWWRLTQELVTGVRIRAPREVFGNPLPHPAHRADVVRLEKLLEHGGIYLDTDVFVHRDFDALLHHRVVLGREGGNDREIGLCNAVILAEAGAPFLRRWYAEYKSFRSRGRDMFYNEHSVRIPARLAKEHPDEVTILPPSAFFWPLWDDAGLERIFRSIDAIPMTGRYANHLWESNAWDRFLLDLTPGQIRCLESNFHLWARPFVAKLPNNFGKPSIITHTTRNLRRFAYYLGPKLYGRIGRLIQSIIRKLSIQHRG